jgi:hypothetical protein
MEDNSMNKKRIVLVLAVILCLVVLIGIQSSAFAGNGNALDPSIPSLNHISIDGLRGRNFGSTLTIKDQLGDDSGSSDYSQYYGPPYYNTYMASYESDRLHVYSRVDIPPTDMPEDGYPVIVFAHGWVGASGAPTYTFNYGPGSYYGDMLDAYVKAGYVLLMPGFRGHGTVSGMEAEGIEWMYAYDNGSYLSTIFYAIDILNLLDSADSLDDEDWGAWGVEDVKIDTSRIFLTAHSQGGDAAFTAFTVGSSPKLDNHFAGASLWASSIEGRIEQGAFFGPQERSADAWSDPAYFPHMPSWWSPSWSPYTIEEGIAYRKGVMYDTVRTWVSNQKNADPDTNSLVEVMATLDAAKHTKFINAPLDLHYSNMDHYSIPEWNESVMRIMRSMGGTGNAYMYEGNSHEFEVIGGWSPPGSVAGREIAIDRTIALFDSIP